DAPPVGREAPLHGPVEREPPRRAALGRHDVEVEAALAVAVEEDHGPVGRPVGDDVGRLVERELARRSAVDGHDEDVVVAGGTRDRCAGRRGGWWTSGGALRSSTLAYVTDGGRAT